MGMGAAVATFVAIMVMWYARCKYEGQVAILRAMKDLNPGGDCPIAFDVRK